MGTSIRNNQSQEETVLMPASTSESEWRLANNGNALVRRLRGVELMIKYSEHYNDGNVSWLDSYRLHSLC